MSTILGIFFNLGTALIGTVLGVSSSTVLAGLVVLAVAILL